MPQIDIARWLLVLAGALLLGGTGAANWAVLVGYLTTRKRGSMVPLVGGATAAVGLALAPVAWVRHCWWLPLLLDPGCAIWAAEYVRRVVRRRSADERTR